MRNLAESLFWEIFYGREAVRAELAALLQVSAPTVSRAAGAFLAKGLVVETGASAALRGRRPALLRINPDLAYVGGIEMDRDRITAVVTDLQGNLLGRGAMPASPVNDVEATLCDAARALRVALKDAGLRQNQLARIGVGHTGMLDVERGLRLEWEGAPHWRGVPLAGMLRAALETQITLDDRARAVALALQLTWPEARRHRIAIYVQIGTGIGAGIFVNGRMLRGATRTGGEIGHMTIDRKWAGMRVRPARLRGGLCLARRYSGARTATLGGGSGGGGASGRRDGSGGPSGDWRGAGLAQLPHF